MQGYAAILFVIVCDAASTSVLPMRPSCFFCCICYSIPAYICCKCPPSSSLFYHPKPIRSKSDILIVIRIAWDQDDFPLVIPSCHMTSTNQWASSTQTKLICLVISAGIKSGRSFNLTQKRGDNFGFCGNHFSFCLCSSEFVPEISGASGHCNLNNSPCTVEQNEISCGTLFSFSVIMFSAAYSATK